MKLLAKESVKPIRIYECNIHQNVGHIAKPVSDYGRSTSLLQVFEHFLLLLERPKQTYTKVLNSSNVNKPVI
jgi:hypothetical protein